MMTRNWLVAIVILLAFALPMFAGAQVKPAPRRRPRELQRSFISP